MMRRYRSLLLAGTAAWIACGPVGAPPEPMYVTNSCPCQPTVSCSAGICTSNALIDPLLVIAFPDSSRDYPGVTLTVLYSELTSPRAEPCKNTPSPLPKCVQVPAAYNDSGSLSASRELAASTGIGVDLRANSANLPVSVVYYPQDEVDSGVVGAKPTPVDAPLAGLPLLPVPAFSDPAQAYVWRSPVGAGDYERDIVPTDDRFPPSISLFTFPPIPSISPTTFPPPVASPPYTQVDDAGVPGSTELTITWPEQDLRGFQIFLRNSVTKRRVSSRVTITEVAPGPLTLNTVGLSSLGGGPYEKVLAPPAGAPIPVFADPLPPTPSPMTAVVPKLATPILVSGIVEAPDHTPIEADLLFDSTPANPLNDQGGIAILSSSSDRNSGRRALSYSTTAHSSPGTGHYVVTLPPGQYDVFVSPTDPSVAASASGTMTIRVQDLPPYNYTAGAQTLSASAFATLHGTVRAADGRPLPGARVEVHPAALDVATIDPRRWRRVRATTTAADGTYSLDVEPDPGMLDMVVLPVDGTGFPVTTRSGVPVAVGTTSLQDVVVPAPIAIDLVLHDPADNPVGDALVRAFVPSATSPPSSVPATVPHAALEIGSWRTDATGHLQMLLAPPP
jgi:hypothetical protein